MKSWICRSSLALFLISFIGNANAESLTWRFRNNSSDLVLLEIVSKSRSVAWPGNNKAFTIPADGEMYTYPISCIAGEYVCYGAWIGRLPNLYWGGGRSVRQGCNDCCYHCNGGETQIYNLTESGCQAGINCE